MNRRFHSVTCEVGAFGTVMLPLLAGWAAAFATLPDVPTGHILVIGAVATGAAVVLGASLWLWSLGGAPAGGLLPLFAAAVAAGLWVWLQYALNPYRMRPIGEAMLASHAAPWQVMAGLWLFGSVVILARARRAEPQRPVVQQVEPAAALDPLTIRLGDRIIVVPTNEVERIQAADDYVAVFTGGRRLLASYRLADLAARLDSRWFVRIHRSHIVNLKYVESFARADAERVRVRMRSGDIVPASRAGSAALRRAASLKS